MNEIFTINKKLFLEGIEQTQVGEKVNNVNGMLLMNNKKLRIEANVNMVDFGKVHQQVCKEQRDDYGCTEECY